MKKLFNFLTIIALPVYGFAQAADTIQTRAYLFEHFIDGAVLMKNGSVEKASLNYNTNDQTVLYMANSETMILGGLDKIDTIQIQNKLFVPINDKIYQVVYKEPNVGLLVSYTNKMRPAVATTEKEGTVKKVASEVSNTISGVYVSQNFKGDFIVELIRHFLIKKGNVVYKTENEKQFIKVFPHLEAAIRQHIQDNHTNFNSENDLVELLQFCLKKG